MVGRHGDVAVALDAEGESGGGGGSSAAAVVESGRGTVCRNEQNGRRVWV